MKIDRELVEKWTIVVLLTGLAIWMIWNETQPPKPLPIHGPHVCYAGAYQGYSWVCTFHTREDFCNAKPWEDGCKGERR